MISVSEDNASGKLNDKRFAQLSEGYEREQAELDSFEADSANAGKFLELIRKHTNFAELTSPMLHEFVEKVVVHEAIRSSGEREQQVEIYLNFIGKFEVPDEEGAAQKQAEDEEQKRAMWREYKRRERARKKGKSA